MDAQVALAIIAIIGTIVGLGGLMVKFILSQVVTKTEWQAQLKAAEDAKEKAEKDAEERIKKINEEAEARIKAVTEEAERKIRVLVEDHLRVVSGLQTTIDSQTRELKDLRRKVTGFEAWKKASPRRRARENRQLKQEIRDEVIPPQS